MSPLEQKNEELTRELQKIANDNNVLLMSFIAPDKIVRKSPVSFDYATITVKDLYNIEKKIEDLKKQGNLPKKIHLVLQTPGGELYASIKIIRYLQKTFDQIEAYVPYEAASGGTMMCLAANTIIMDATSSLTPIDPQVRYKDQRIAATSYNQAMIDFQKDYGKYRPEEIPSPYQQLSYQFDPVIAKEMDKIVWDTLSIAYQTLKISQKPKTKKDMDSLLNIVFSLGKTNYPHSHVVTIDEAKSIGLNISEAADKLKLLETYKKWVSVRLEEEETSHIIDTFCPKKNETKSGQKSKIKVKK